MVEDGLLGRLQRGEEGAAEFEGQVVLVELGEVSDRVEVSELLWVNPLGELLEREDVVRRVVELVEGGVQITLLRRGQGVKTRSLQQAFQSALCGLWGGGVAEFDVWQHFRLLRIERPRTTGGDDLLRLDGQDLLCGHVARFGVEEAVSEVLTAGCCDKVTEVGLVDGRAAILETGCSPDEGLWLVFELGGTFGDLVDALCVEVGELLGIVLLIDDLAEELDGLGGILQGLLPEVGEYVLQTCLIELGEETGLLRGLLVVKGHDDHVWVVGDEVFNCDIALGDIADGRHVFQLGVRLEKLGFKRRRARMQIAAHGDNVVTRVFVVKHRGDKHGAAFTEHDSFWLLVEGHSATCDISDSEFSFVVGSLVRLCVRTACCSDEAQRCTPDCGQSFGLWRGFSLGENIDSHAFQFLPCLFLRSFWYLGCTKRSEHSPLCFRHALLYNLKRREKSALLVIVLLAGLGSLISFREPTGSTSASLRGLHQQVVK